MTRKKTQEKNKQRHIHMLGLIFLVFHCVKDKILHSVEGKLMLEDHIVKDKDFEFLIKNHLS